MAETNETPAEQNVKPEQTPGAEQPKIGQDDKNMAMLCHLLAIFTGFLGPLVIWLIKKDDSPFIDDQGKEALNFQLTVLIAVFALTVVCIGVVLLPAVCVVDIVFCILAAIMASKGEAYRYPVNIRFVK